MKKINLGFSNYSDAELGVVLQAVKAAFTGNVYFPGPIPELTAMSTALDDYLTALSDAKNGGKTEVALKNQKRDDLIAAAIKLANYATLQADGDEVKLTSTGFPISKSRQPKPPMEKPEIIKVSDGVNAGELEISIKKVDGARVYVYQYTPDPLTNVNVWSSQNSTLVKCSLTNLESTKKYWCRVVAYGNNEQVVYSDPVARVVQ